MRIICDLHLHSRYSLATSPKLDIRTLAGAATRVGIDLLAAPDFTHPVWRDEMRAELVETNLGSGIFSAFGKAVHANQRGFLYMETEYRRGLDASIS